MSDDPEDPELENLFAIARAALTAELHTCQPGLITSYNKNTQTASVQLALQTRHVQEDDSELAEPVPELHDVIVMHSGPGKNRITYPVKSGDVVLVHFCEASISTFKVKGGMVNDKDPRRHNLNDAIAVLAPHTGNSPPTDAPVDAIVHHVDNGILIKLGGSSGTQKTMMADLLKTAIDALMEGIRVGLVAAGNTTTGGTAIGVAFEDVITAFDTAFNAAKTSTTEVK